jgi:glutathione peroxidase-family protein
MELQAQIEKLRELYDQYKAKDLEAKELYHTVESEEVKLQQVLEQLDTTEYAEVSKKYKVGLAIKHSAKVPKDDESRALFFQWLKDKDYYDQYITVHSKSITSLVEQEAKLLEQSMEELGIPGLVISKRVTVKY